MQKLKVVAVTSSEETRTVLYSQLQGLPFVQFDGVYIELSEGVRQCKQTTPDVIIVELTGREMDAGLFIQAILMNPDVPWSVIALHRHVNPQIVSTTTQQGAKAFIHYPEERLKLDEALKSELESRTQQKRAKNPGGKGTLFSVFSAKGGAGASTIAANLANELRQLTQESVVFFDLDPVFCNTPIMMNLKPNYSLGDLSDSNPQDIDDKLFGQIVQHLDGGLDVVVASKNVLDDNPLISLDLLQRTLSYLTSHYAYCVVDLPTHVLDPYHQLVVEASDSALLLSSLDIPGLFRTRQYLDLARRYLDMSKVKLVLNRWNLRAAYGMSNQSLEDEFGYPVYARITNDWDLAVEANSLGKMLTSVNPKAELSKSIQKLAAVLSGKEAPDTETENGKGLLGLFLGGNAKETAKQAGKGGR